MFKLFIAIHFFILALFACDGGFESCRLKVVDSNAVQGQSLHIPLENRLLLIFSSNPPNEKILKHDPFLNLYLTEDKKRFKYPFRVNMNLSLGEASINRVSAIEGKIVKNQIGLDGFGVFNEQVAAPALLLNSCCALEGIVTHKGIIQKEYINRFLKVKNVSYSDLGIKVKDIQKKVVVEITNSFIKNNPFKKGDIILELDGRKVQNSADFSRDILFSEVGSRHTLKILRDSQEIIIKTESQKKLGGGFLSDTFLESIGILFDENLHVVKVEEKARHFGLLVGDRLLEVNLKGVKTHYDVSKIVSENIKSLHLLFERENFQFFVKVN